MKLTKRKAFNFLRSYFDVLNELKEDSDKLDFLLSIIDKQFLDEDPKELGFIPKLCYESQRHAIEKSVKGWKTANKTDMSGNPILPSIPPLPLPSTPPKGSPLPLPPKEEQEKGEEQEEEKVKKEVIESLYSLYPTRCPINSNSTGKSKTNKDKIKNLLKVTTEEHLKYTINRYKDECIKDKRYMKNFATFLNNLPDYEKEVDPHALDEKYVYYQWKREPSKMARRVLKEDAKKLFEGQLLGGYEAVILKSIKNKNKVW